MASETVVQTPPLSTVSPTGLTLIYPEDGSTANTQAELKYVKANCALDNIGA
jgi:hypothetical protein